jgi:hypothetical protein
MAAAGGVTGVASSTLLPTIVAFDLGGTVWCVLF